MTEKKPGRTTEKSLDKNKQRRKRQNIKKKKKNLRKKIPPKCQIIRKQKKKEGFTEYGTRQNQKHEEYKKQKVNVKIVEKNTSKIQLEILCLKK